MPVRTATPAKTARSVNKTHFLQHLSENGTKKKHNRQPSVLPLLLLLCFQPNTPACPTPVPTEGPATRSRLALSVTVQLAGPGPPVLKVRGQAGRPCSTATALQCRCSESGCVFQTLTNAPRTPAPRAGLASTWRTDLNASVLRSGPARPAKSVRPTLTSPL